MRADTEWQCRQEDMLPLRLRDMGTSSGVVYSSLCTLILLILPATLAALSPSTEATEKEQLGLETTQNSVYALDVLCVQDTLGTRCKSWVSSLARRATRWTCVFPPSRTDDAVITCFRCAWRCLHVAGMCSCRRNGAVKKWQNVPLIRRAVWFCLCLADVAFRQFVKHLFM